MGLQLNGQTEDIDLNIYVYISWRHLRKGEGLQLIA